MRYLGRLFIVGILLFSFGCAKQFKAPTFDIEVEKVNVTPIPPYIVDLDSIPKPDKIKPIYVDSDFKQVNTASEAAYVMLVPKEYAKIGQLLKLAKTYKGIVEEQGNLVNHNIDIANGLKEYLALEQEKAEQYKKLWVDSENAYRQEKLDHTMSNLVHRTGMIVITVGAIVVCILAL